MGTSRSRTLGGFTNQVGYVYGGPSGAPTSFAYPSTEIGWRKTMNDEINPGFASRSARGEIVSSPYSSDEWNKSGSMVDSLWSGMNGSTLWAEGGSRPYYSFPSAPPYPTAFGDSLALASAVNQANAGVTPNYASVAVTVAELDKTMRMFRAAGQTAKDFGNIMIAAARSLRGKKNTVRNQKRAMSDIANLWLQARYGWLPTVYDIQGMMKSFNEPFHQRNTSRGAASVNRSGSGQVVGSWRGTYGYTYSWKQETSYRAGIMYENMGDLGAVYSSRLGLSMTDALTVPWELVPFSFVVDWFIDCGDWLRAISPKPGVRNLASWTTTHATTTIISSGAFVNCTQSGWTGSASGGTFTVENIVRKRILSANPTIPGYGSGLNVNRSIDSATLAFQQLKGLLGFSRR